MDGYRADKQRGKTLNPDQEAAIEKYEEVLQSLEFARDLSVQFKTLVAEESKSRKKQVKKDLQERLKGETDRVAATLEIQVMKMKKVTLRRRGFFIDIDLRFRICCGPFNRARPNPTSWPETTGRSN